MSDLYQIGGELAFNQGAIEFLAMTPGGDWGKPDDRIELANVETGTLDFAITTKYMAPGISGSFDAAVFRFRIVDEAADPYVKWAVDPVVRNSKKHDITIAVGGDS